MMQPVHLICGVSGSGKSWVARQHAHRFHYIPHDRCWVHPDKPSWDPASAAGADTKDDSRYLPKAKSNHLEVLVQAAKVAEKPVLTECPFGERVLREGLEKAGIKVIPYFVVESPATVRDRYEKRERRPVPKAVLTRAESIRERAAEWGAPAGTSAEIHALLSKLKEVS